MRIERMQIVYAVGVLLIASFASFKFFYLSFKDEARYHKMVHKKTLATSFQTTYNPTEQKRSKVKKEIWFAQEDGTRLHYCIDSAESLLTLTPIQNKFELIESLRHFHCWMQEKLLPSSQQTRYFEAEEGLYRYRTAQLIAREATFSLYRLPGTDLPTQPLDQKNSYLRGIAENISVTFGGKIPEFKASHFKALLTGQKS